MMVMVFSAIRTALGLSSSINGLLVAIVAGVTAFVGYGYYMQRVGATKAVERVVEQSKTEAKSAHAKSEKARVAANRPGAADRLRADRATCRDCR